MNKNILIICDEDKNYCKKLDSYIRESLSIPFDIYEITDMERLKAFADRGKNIILLIAQSLYERIRLDEFKHVLVLRDKERCLEEEESGYGTSNKNVKYTDKYQKSEKITESILNMCLDIPEIVVNGSRRETEKRIKTIGFYTPVLNNTQTREALNFAKKLSAKSKTIYINTDSLCTNEIIRNEAYGESLIDLLYYAECSSDKFILYLERIVKHEGGIDFIPAANSVCQARMITSDEYGRLIEKIDRTDRYETIVLDIAEGVNDLFGMIHMCDELYMLSDESDNSHIRMEQFLKELKRDESYNYERLHILSQAGGSRL